MNKKFQREIESSVDYVLPDYLGDVKKVLSSSAKAVPSGKFENSSELELVGSVQYDLVYLDSENKLSAASFSSDYDSFVDLGSQARDTYVRCAVSTYSIRLTGPRRIVAKTNVSVDGVAALEDELAVFGSAFDGTYEPKVQYNTVRLERMSTSSVTEREYADEAHRIEGVNADEVEVISSGAIVRISDAEAEGGGVKVRGVITMSAIIRVNSEQPFAISREIPFEETIEIRESLDGASAIADAYVTSAVCSLNEVPDGVSIVANVILDLSCLVLGNEELSLATDAYLCERNTEERYERIKYTEHISAFCEEVSASVKLPLAESVGEGFSELLSLVAVFRAPDANCCEEDAKIKAEAQFSGIACQINENNENVIVPVKFSCPISFDVNNNLQKGENFFLSVRLSPCYAEWSVDGDRLVIKCRTEIKGSVSAEHSCERLVSSEIVGDESFADSIAKIRVYYPEPGEDLYSIAKRYHTTVDAILSANEITESVDGISGEACLPRLIIG